ncbi:Rrg1p PWA37_003689 [Arxiozyma heterogenica]|uniref:Rrg1p n=1 Tax=Arxiozyma heterogenica TaxID=278026 RepID=UPI002F0FC3C0
MSHFSSLQAHRKSVLTLYRHVLRNINHNLYSIGFANAIKNELNTTIRRFKNQKSSWTIYAQLKHLNELNNNIIDHNLDEVKTILKSRKQRLSRLQMKPKTLRDSQLAILHNIVKQLTPWVTPSENPTNTREYKTQMNILSDYCQKKQKLQLLPTGILKKYKRELLLPIVLYEYGLKQINKISRQLAKGPPPTYLSYTMEGKSKIWFVRSAVNKHKNQSKGLGRIIRETRRRHQSEIDSIDLCHRFHAFWAVEEAKWEQMIDTNSNCLHNKTAQKDNNITLDKYMKLKGNSQLSPLVNEWLQPLKMVIEKIEQDSRKRSQYFEDFKKNRLIDGGQYDYYKKEAENMYWKRKERFEKMIIERIPSTSPFYRNKENNLITILKDNHFITF